MKQCPKCQYRTNNPGQMIRHIAKTRHGQGISARKEFKGHLNIKSKKKG
jgi:hypothetical protein